MNSLLVKTFCFVVFLNGFAALSLKSRISSAIPGAENSARNSDQEGISLEDLFDDLLVRLNNVTDKKGAVAKLVNLSSAHFAGFRSFVSLSQASSPNGSAFDRLEAQLMPTLYAYANTWIPKNNALSQLYFANKRTGQILAQVWILLDSIFQHNVPTELKKFMKASSANESNLNEKESLICTLKCLPKFGLGGHGLTDQMQLTFSGSFCSDYLDGIADCLEMCQFMGGEEAKFSTFIHTEFKKFVDSFCGYGTGHAIKIAESLEQLAQTKLTGVENLHMTEDQLVEIFLKITRDFNFVDRFMEMERAEKQCGLTKATVVDDIVNLLGKFFDKRSMDLLEPVLRIFSAVTLSLNTEAKFVNECPKFYEV